ncbi:hypothetical protein chiPu_0019803 [Chiloscyllium punctatum]|uniref:Uncharacterized protein n=1 Tax=Chiloscyllium punctatum TaxID=137246 RepID=A0A401RT69_CHIPU|nr:hypothetical protein [Chiloscyllium punctatum]
MKRDKARLSGAKRANERDEWNGMSEHALEGASESVRPGDRKQSLMGESERDQAGGDESGWMAPSVQTSETWREKAASLCRRG